MALLRRHPTLPDDVRARLEVPPGDRVLAAAELTDGWAVATPRHLHVLPTEGPPTRRAWCDVSGARMDPDAAVLTVTWVDGAPPTALRLTDDRSRVFPDTVRQCIDSSILLSEKVPLPAGREARVALRRDADGGLLTQVVGTPDVDLTDPATAAAVDAAEARLREAAGLR
jgi:hypothetical protein